MNAAIEMIPIYRKAISKKQKINLSIVLRIEEALDILLLQVSSTLDQDLSLSHRSQVS